MLTHSTGTIEKSILFSLFLTSTKRRISFLSFLLLRFEFRQKSFPAFYGMLKWPVDGTFSLPFPCFFPIHIPWNWWDDEFGKESVVEEQEWEEEREREQHWERKREQDSEREREDEGNKSKAFSSSLFVKGSRCCLAASVTRKEREPRLVPSWTVLILVSQSSLSHSLAGY